MVVNMPDWSVFRGIRCREKGVIRQVAHCARKSSVYSQVNLYVVNSKGDWIGEEGR